MMKPFPSQVWNATDDELQSLLDTGSFAAKQRKVIFYAPSFMHYKTSQFCSSTNEFPTISVTGTSCSLSCRHCGGKILETMHPANTPEKLFELATRLRQDGAMGCLVSGGCVPNGSVPLGAFIPAITRMKKELGLTVVVHTGIINQPTARELAKAGVDAALIDIIGSDDTIRMSCGLNVKVEDYENSLKVLSKAHLKFVPHVIVGLHNGELKGEFHALENIAKVNPSALVVIAFMPLRGTEMATVKPPSPFEIAKVVAAARLMFPETPLALGCMRPKGKHRAETDVLALKAGVDAIAFPSEEAMKYAKAHDFNVAFSPYCCSQIYADMSHRSVSK